MTTERQHYQGKKDGHWERLGIDPEKRPSFERRQRLFSHHYLPIEWFSNDILAHYLDTWKRTKYDQPGIEGWISHRDQFKRTFEQDGSTPSTITLTIHRNNKNNHVGAEVEIVSPNNPLGSGMYISEVLSWSINAYGQKAVTFNASRHDSSTQIHILPNGYVSATNSNFADHTTSRIHQSPMPALFSPPAIPTS